MASNFTFRSSPARQENVGMGYEYMNLDCVSAAEREILHTMIFKTPSNQFFEHLKALPEGFLSPPDSQFGGSQEHIHSRQSSQNDFDSGNSSHNQTHDFGVDPNLALTLPRHQNGPEVPVSSQQAPHLMMEHHSMGQGLPQQVQNYYPPGQMIHGGPPQPHSIQVPITVYHQQLAHRQQVLQASAGTFMNHPHHLNQLPHMTQQQYQQMGLQQVPYGMAAGSHGHPQQQNYGPGEDVGHMQKGHHDQHTPGSPGSNKSFRKQTRVPRRGEEGQQQAMSQYAPPYFPGYGMGPYGTVFYSPGPGMAQTVSNVTGQPLILPSSGQQQQGGLYSQYPGHMYPTSPPGGELEHHVGPILHPSTIAQMPPEGLQGLPQPQHPTVLSTLASGTKVIQEFVPAAAAGVTPATTVYEIQQGPMHPVPQREWTDPTQFKTEAEEIRSSDISNTVQPLNSNTLTLNSAGEDKPNPAPAIKEQPITSLASVKARIDEIKPFVPASLIAQAQAQAAAQATQQEVEVLRTNGPTQSQSAPNIQKQGSGVNQYPRQNNVSSQPAKKESNPEFPQLAISNTNTNTSANGVGSGTSLAPAKGRSWASIASSKQANSTNGPTNGVIPAESSSSNTSTSSVVTQSVVVPMSEFKSNSAVPQLYNADPSFDPSCLSNENDPIALSLGEHLSNYVLNHHSLSLTPRGLSNQSNFCYINATLQSLIACPPFVNLFRSMKDLIGKKQCKATPIIQSVFEFVMEFEPITRSSQNTRNKRLTDAFFIGANFEPTGIRKVLGLLDGATFKVEGRQEDAEEFLSHLLNGLHDEMIKLMKWSEAKKDGLNAKPSGIVVEAPVAAPTTRNGDSEVNEEENDEWQVMGPKGKGSMTRKTDFSKSPISEMFLGQMSSLLNRTNTPKTTTLQPFFTLQLDIQDENINSVRDALEGLSTKEEVSCSANGQEVPIWKQLSLEVLPVILVLHLKRFVYDKSGSRVYKLDKKVDFGVDLEIGKDLLSINAKAKYYNTKSRYYKLFAAVYHDGEEAHKGHYVADTFHPSGGSLWGQFGWIRYDDTTVKGVLENQILTPTPPRVPYLLYYRRVDTLSQAKKGPVPERGGQERGSERGSYY